jgi:hypothetical protein
MCLDDGAYVMNFSGCAGCGNKELSLKSGASSKRKRQDSPKPNSHHKSSSGSSSSSEEEEGGEKVKFNHTCQACNHLVATHVYTLKVENQFQEESMDCLLCGHAESSTSVMPLDPRLVSKQTKEEITQAEAAGIAIGPALMLNRDEDEDESTRAVLAANAALISSAAASAHLSGMLEAVRREKKQKTGHEGSHDQSEESEDNGEWD